MQSKEEKNEVDDSTQANSTDEQRRYVKIHGEEEITSGNDDELVRRTQNSPRASEFCSFEKFQKTIESNDNLMNEDRI